ncbi:MAG: tetratricopeptide repeat protein [Rhodanobacteraceae bacterium]
MLKKFKVFAFSLALSGFAFHPGWAVAADALVKPVPSPDLSKLAADQAEALRKVRAEFEKSRATLIGPPLAQDYALIGAAYSLAGFYDAAAVAMYDAAALAPEDGRWVYVQGIIARARHQEADASSYFERAYALDQNYLPIRLAAAEVRVQQGDLAAAQKLLSDYLAKHQDQPAAYETAGRIAMRQKHYSAAIDAFDRALKLDPKADRVYSELADAYAAAGNASAAATARSKAGTRAPALADPLARGVLQGSAQTSGAPTPKKADPVADKVAVAVLNLQKKDYATARRALDDALKLKPGDPVLLGLYARVEGAAGNIAAARKRAEAAVAADPRNALAQYTLGWVLEMGKNDAGAQAAYDKALALDPKLADARLALGNLLMRTSQQAAAAAQYRYLTQSQPDKGEAWAHLVAAESISGHCAVALKEINDALAKRPDYGFLMQLFLRVASTCSAARPEERRMALDYGAKLYRTSNAAQVGEAYALALAANGKWDDAVKTQGAAMFDLVRNGHREAAIKSREFLKKFEAKQIPDQPWPSANALFHPPRPAPDPKTKAQPAAKAGG